MGSMKKYFWITAGLGVLLVAVIPFSQKNKEYSGCGEPIFLEEETSEFEFENYRIRTTTEADGCDVLDIEKDGRSVYREVEAGGHSYIGPMWQEQVKAVNLWKYASGRQAHVLIISQWTGGAHCCYVLKFFELEKNFVKLPEIEDRFAYPMLRGWEEGNFPRIETLDPFLEERFSSYAQSATGKVVLEYVDGKFVPAIEYMKTPLKHPDHKILASIKEEFQRPYKGEWPPPPFIQALTNLTYGGHKEAAENLLNEVWPSQLEGKSEFWKAYEAELKKSEYYPEFERRLVVQVK